MVAHRSRAPDRESSHSVVVLAARRRRFSFAAVGSISNDGIDAARAAYIRRRRIADCY